MLKQEDFLRTIVQVLDARADKKASKVEVEEKVTLILRDELTSDLEHWMARPEKSKVSRLRQTIAFARELGKTRGVISVGERGVWSLSNAYLTGSATLERPARALRQSNTVNGDDRLMALLAA